MKLRKLNKEPRRVSTPEPLAGLATAQCNQHLSRMVLDYLEKNAKATRSRLPVIGCLILLSILYHAKAHGPIAVILLCINALASYWLYTLTTCEIHNRIKSLAVRLSRLQTNSHESRYPWCTQSATSDGSLLVKTWRDCRISLVPSTFLVQGDTIELTRGDVAPCRLRRGDTLIEADSPIQVNGRYEVACEDDEHPLINQVLAALSTSKRIPTIDTLLALSLLLPYSFCLWVYCMNVLRLFQRTHEAARISLLGDKLKHSRTPYEEDAFDEFDEEAPPPTQDIKLSPLEVIVRAWEILSGGEHVNAEWLTWNVDLADCLSKVSVMSFLDREGPIASPLPRPAEIIIPVQGQAEVASAEILPNVNNPSRVVIGFSDSTLVDGSQLRALGLSCLLCTDCISHGSSYRKDWHKKKFKTVPMCTTLHPSLQTCLCPVAKAIGFVDAAANPFTLVQEVSYPDHGHYHHHHGLLVAQRFSQGNNNNEFGHTFCYGDLQSVLEACSNAWNTQAVIPIGDSLRWKLKDLWQDFVLADIDTIAFAYLPTKDQHSPPKQDLIFLGAVAMEFGPREDMQEFIDDLGQAGIRFVYFSPYSERVSKAFGERLGLETDWNSCILLSNVPVEAHKHGSSLSNKVTRAQGYHAASDVKARLPRGPAHIREHLQTVDDIPLHVSIFAECRAESGLIESMLDIYREWNETVVVIGSLVADKPVESSRIFAHADMSIGMLPGQLDEMTALGAAFFGCRCSLYLPFESSPYVLTELIREARTLTTIREAQLELVVQALILSWIDQTAFVYSLALSAALYATPYNDNIMKLIVIKQSSIRRRLSWHLLKTISMITAALLSGQGSVFLSISACFLVDSPIKNKSLTALMTLCLVSSLLLALGHPLQECFLLLLGILVVSLLHWSAHSIQHSHHEQEQKRAKLEFNTKLGMHSPV